MIGDRVQWAHNDQDGQPLFPERGGVVRAVALANGQWHVLVQGVDGEYRDELASNLATRPAEPGAPWGTETVDADREALMAELASKLAAREEAIGRLRDYIAGEGLDESAVLEPCMSAIELLRTFQAELLTVGAARDTAIHDRDEAVSRLSSAYDTVKAELLAVGASRDAALRRADELVVELEAAKKRKRPPGRSSEDS